MEDGAFGGSFGKYDITTHNQNSRNTGYKNTLNVDSNFSTTLGASFTTVVGANFSTTGGFNIPFTIGGKIELISPVSIKWTRGTPWQGTPDSVSMTALLPGGNLSGYDYDFKNCATQVKWNEGQIYNYSKHKATEYVDDTEGSTVILKKEAAFIKEGSAFCEKHTLTTRAEVKLVGDGNLKYTAMTTTVADECNISGGGGMTSLSMNAYGAKLHSPGLTEISGDMELTLKCKAKASWSAAILNLG